VTVCPRKPWADLVRKRRTSSPTPKLLDGATETKLIALRPGRPKAGDRPSTLRLLADQLVELQVVDSIGPVTVRQTLKKRHDQAEIEYLVIPPDADGEFVAHMEEVLFEDVADARAKASWYGREYNAVRPHTLPDNATPNAACRRRGRVGEHRDVRRLTFGCTRRAPF
jgi:hypothetical protein